ncbi:tannase/feruloyl esterase family alpha/beta hydrolase [Sphingosinicellaceae bacterium]|nr:tannase/feruloyl esterase family alpha/beta hydrolase [Sphingosinicellaceae bacterium]
MRYSWLAGIAALVAAPAAAVDCSALAATTIPGASVTSATAVPAGAEPLKQPRDFCRVAIIAKPTTDSAIRIELWIPAGSGWNGKYLQVGNGGFAGKIPYGSLGLGLAAGYAVAGTDDGHQSTDSTDASWALGHPEKLIDFGSRAVKVTTDAAKAVLAAYGSPPKKSYFFGCSDGGREALMTAQRYPRDFDGIVAGAAASDWTSLQASAAVLEQKARVPGAMLSKAKLPALQAAALKACGGGGWVADPTSCRFDPAVLLCKGAASDQCLTKSEVATVRAIYRGVVNPATGKHLPGLKPGAEAQPGSWDNWLLGRNAGATGASDRPEGFAANWFGYVVRGDPKFSVAGMTRADFVKSETFASVVNSTDPDLTAFRTHGGKLIQYHGWNDPAISPEYSIAYTAALRKKYGDVADFHRLYLVPGMLHCGGGASPSQVDWLGALAAWVEQGQAPGTLTAKGAAGATQSLAPY